MASYKILVVDDHMDGAFSLAALLRVKGFEVEIAHNGREALDKLQEFAAQAMIVDLGMPFMGGMELARSLRALPEHDDLLLIAHTGWTEDETETSAMDAGFDHFTLKPLPVEELLELLAPMRSLP